jgi:hypothetical protein
MKSPARSQPTVSSSGFQYGVSHCVNVPLIVRVLPMPEL